MGKTSSDRKIITAEEVANYTVCPEAWRLKYHERKGGKKQTERGEQSKELRKQWVANQDLSSKLRSYAKIAYFLLVILAIVVFMLEHRRTSSGVKKHLAQRPGISTELNKSAPAPSSFSESVRRSTRTVPSEIFLLLLTLGLLIFMWDLFERRSKTIRKDTGLSDSTELISLRGSSQLPAKTYSSQKLGISSRPDALIIEDDCVIPVDIKPTANKVRDRHVIALMVHLRLIEEVEGKAPPYGILLMGEKKRLVKVKNSPDKQRWLEALLDEMVSILDGIPAVPAPAPYKCRQCDVRDICTHCTLKN